jgi:hypothetical protein
VLPGRRQRAEDQLSTVEQLCGQRFVCFWLAAEQLEQVSEGAESIVTVSTRAEFGAAAAADTTAKAADTAARRHCRDGCFESAGDLAAAEPDKS